MYGIDSANSNPTRPTPAALATEGFFKDGVAAGADGTLVDADFLNMVMLSLLAVLDDQSIPHSKSDETKLVQAITAKIAAEAPNEVAATTTVAGISEIATSAEVEAGTDTGRIVTPDGLASLVSGTGLEGKFRFPTGGGSTLLVQIWSETVTSSLMAVTLPEAYADANYCVLASLGAGGSAIDGRAYPSSASQLTLDGWATSATAYILTMGVAA